ncbi:MAG: glycosyltransferase [Pseudomonadales bacterium]|nr:glycosyltransferase [Pseudomonadales bacterium]
MTKPKILILGKKGGILNWPEYVINACETLGVTHSFFPTNHLTTTSRLQSKIIKSLDKSRFIKIQANALQQQICNFSPDLIFFIDSLGLNTELISVVDKYKSRFRTAHWIGDHYNDSILDINAITDRFYFTDSSLLEHAYALNLNQPKILGLAVDENIFHQKSDDNLEEEHFLSRNKAILFIAAYSENRREIIEGIDMPMHIYGKGWGQLKTHTHRIHSKNISLKQVAKLNHKHQVILNIINSNNITNGLNMRCFEACASGAVLLTDKVKDLPYYFNQEEVISYANCNDLNAKLANIYKHPEGLYQTAKKGQKKTTTQHTYKNRLLSVVADLN